MYTLGGQLTFRFDCLKFQNAWLYHLTMSSGRVDQTGTDLEQTVAKLRELDGDTGRTMYTAIRTQI